MLNPILNFVSLADLAAIVRNGLPKIPAGVDLVVGIPRSGMIPAYQIGLALNLHVSDLQSFLDDRPCGHGRTRNAKTEMKTTLEAGSILLVDDSLNSGKSLKAAMERIAGTGFKGKVTTCVAIGIPDPKFRADVILKTVPSPRIFEWNVFHHEIVQRTCFDFDGVLCEDPTPDQNDDGPKYLDFLKNAPARYLPSYPIGCVVTSRLEKYRSETKAWLDAHGVAYGAIHMLDLPSKEDRLRLKAHHTHKIAYYKKTDADLFIESSYSQAVEIARGTGKPVLCTDEMIMIQGSGLDAKAAMRGLAQKKRKLRSKLSRLIPKNIKSILKRLLRKQ